MKTFNLILVFVMTGFTYAQNFSGIGIRWTYNDHDSSTHQNYPRTIVYATDTVIDGIPCYILLGDCNCGTSQTNYVYEINRRVYWYNVALGDFTLLYDYNLNPGQTWNVIAHNTTADSLTLRVDSVTVDTINGNLRKVQYITTLAVYGNAYVFEGPVVEGIGSKFCLYPQYAACAPLTVGLRCFEGTELGFYDTHLAPVFCEQVFVDSGIGIPEAAYNIPVSCFPNPMHDAAIISFENSPAGHGTFVLADVTGRKIVEEEFSGNRIELQRRDMEDGIYFYRLVLGHRSASGKIIMD